MRRYETIFIADPDLTQEARDSFFDRIASIINEHNGLHVETEVWGNKRLAYTIKKKERGHYIRFDYCGAGETVKEIERASRIDDRILKYMTVLLDETPELDRIREEIERRLAEKRAAESEEAEVVDPEAVKTSDDSEDLAPVAEGDGVDLPENEITESKES